MKTNTTAYKAKSNTKFFSKIVSPINNIKIGMKKGKYTAISNYISKKTVPLAKAQGKKQVYLIPFNGITIDTSEYYDYLKKLCFKFCKNAPNYLLGLMAETSEDELVKEIKQNQTIVAAEDRRKSIFTNDEGDKSFLAVFESGNYRKLETQSLRYRSLAVGVVLLAEKLKKL